MTPLPGLHGAGEKLPKSHSRSQTLIARVSRQTATSFPHPLQAQVRRTPQAAVVQRLLVWLKSRLLRDLRTVCDQWKITAIPDRSLHS